MLVTFVDRVKSAADVGVRRKILKVDRESVAELVDGFVKELMDVLGQVSVVSGKASPVFKGRAYREKRYAFLLGVLYQYD
jgi:hypothetical protein